MDLLHAENNIIGCMKLTISKRKYITPFLAKRNT